MAAEVDLHSHSWSFPEYPSHDQSQDEPVRDHGSISFGRYEMESLSWEKKSVFTHDRRQEELHKLTLPGSVAQKKAYFEQYYTKVRNLKGLNANNTPSGDETQTSNESQTSNENETQTSNDVQTSTEIQQTSNENENENENEIENSDEIKNSDVIQTSDEIETAIETENPDENETANEMENSNEIQTSAEAENSNEIQISDEILVSNDEIRISNGSISNSISTTVCATEVQSDEKEREKTENNNITIQESVPAVPVQLVQRKTKEKSEHGQKLARAFDNLSKEWVKLKKGMTPIRRNAGAESQNRQKFESLKNGVSCAVKRSFGTVKDVMNNSQKKESNVDKNKNPDTQLKPIKESQKISFQSANLVQKYSFKSSKIGTTGTKSRPGTAGTKSQPGTASSCNKPVLLAKSSIGTKNIIRRNEAKYKEKSVVSSSSENNKRSVRSSWESLMRPTAASSARANTTEVKRTNIGVRKPVSKVTRPLKRDSSVPPKPRSFSRNKSRPNSVTTLRATERKKTMEKKVISSGTKRVVAKRTSDSNTRLRKALSARTETSSINKRTKLSASSSLNNNKKQRQERPAWR